MKVNNCKSEEFNMHKYPFPVIFQALSLDILQLSFWGVTAKFEKIDTHDESIEDTINKVEIVAKNILINADRMKLHNFAFCSYLPLGYGYRESRWMRLFQSAFIKNENDFPNITIDFYLSSNPQFRNFAVSKIMDHGLPESVKKYLSKYEELIKRAKDNNIKNNYSLGEYLLKLKDVISKEEAKESEVENEQSINRNERIVNEIKKRINEIDNNQYDPQKYIDYLNQFYVRRAKEEIDAGIYPVATTEEKAINGWRKKFNGELYFLPGLKDKFHDVFNGINLDNYRLLILWLAFELKMSTEETEKLFEYGNITYEAETDEEAMLMILIDYKIYNDSEEDIYEMLELLGYDSISDVAGYSVEDKPRGIEK